MNGCYSDVVLGALPRGAWRNPCTAVAQISDTISSPRRGPLLVAPDGPCTVAWTRNEVKAGTSHSELSLCDRTPLKGRNDGLLAGTREEVGSPLSTTTGLPQSGACAEHDPSPTQDGRPIELPREQHLCCVHGTEHVE